MMRAVVDAGECVGCGACGQLCPLGAIEMPEGTAVVDETKCDGCGICVVACFTEAVTLAAPAGAMAKGG